MFQAGGDAVAFLFSDLQDPPELLRRMIDEWDKGIPVVVGIKFHSGLLEMATRRGLLWQCEIRKDL